MKATERLRWPWVWRSDHERLITENFTLRDALREANEELRKHRALIAGLRGGVQSVQRAVEKAIMPS